MRKLREFFEARNFNETQAQTWEVDRMDLKIETYLRGVQSERDQQYHLSLRDHMGEINGSNYYMNYLNRKDTIPDPREQDPVPAEIRNYVQINEPPKLTYREIFRRQRAQAMALAMAARSRRFAARRGSDGGASSCKAATPSARASG